METARPAGFWIRAAAIVIDGVIIALVQRSFILVGRLMYGLTGADVWSVSSLIGGFTLVFTAAYTTVLHATAGQTIGKLALGIRVVGLDGERLTVGQAFLRWLGYAVSFATLGLGFLMAGLRRDKRALHDLIAGTAVERGERQPVVPAPPVDEPIEAAPDVG
jgi:uncharacterized RDD family membrane protein YckC